VRIERSGRKPFLTTVRLPFSSFLSLYLKGFDVRSLINDMSFLLPYTRFGYISLLFSTTV
ncbi:MAG: hypothetical protein KBI10_08830, partial [Syntrophorhabdales bacterium]|nr:hypothetical protein [Syntrophorhabdales bacterium]